MNYLLPSLNILGLLSAYIAGSIFLRSDASQRISRSWSTALHIPPATFLLLLAVFVPTTIQFFFPQMLPVFQRDSIAFFHGEWWRLLTPLFFQDGGVRGAIFNLISLLLVSGSAEKLWDRRTVIGIFFCGGLVGEAAGMFWQPIGAGNSVGTFSLAASIAVACLTRQSQRSVQMFALLALSAAGVLLALRNIHGAAAAAGCVLSLELSRRRRNQHALSPPISHSTRPR